MSLYPALIWDTETTGIPDFHRPSDHSSQPRLVSLAVTLFDKGGVADSFYSLVRPSSFDIPAESTRIHGIKTWQAYEQGKPLNVLLQMFLELYRQAKVSATFGLSFDTKILRGEMKRCGLAAEFGKVPEFCVMTACTPLCKCPPTQAMLATGRRGPKTPRLEEAAKIILGIDKFDAHNAQADVEVTCKLYDHLAGKDLVKPFPPHSC